MHVFALSSLLPKKLRNECMGRSVCQAPRQILERVRQAANIMPKRQLEQVLTQELGADWTRHFRDFDLSPIAAASIGQVHRATLPDGTVVCVCLSQPICMHVPELFCPCVWTLVT